MKRSFAILFILILSNAFATDPDLQITLPPHLKSDTGRAGFFYREGFVNRIKHPQYSFECAKQCEHFAIKSGSPFHMAQSCNLLGVLHYRRHDLSTAITYHKKALDLRNGMVDKQGIAISLMNLGNIYSDLKRYLLAESFYLEALKINNELGNMAQTGNCHVNLGTLQTEQGNITAAKNYFQKAIENARKRNDYELEAMCLNNLSVINIRLGHYDDAIANCMNSLKIKELMSNEMEMADSYLNLALAYSGLKNEKAETEALTEAERIISKYNYLAAKLLFLKQRSEQSKKEKHIEKAFNYLNEYVRLKDSLATATDASGEINFTTTRVISHASSTFEFPNVYLNVLIILSILTAVFVFRFKS